MTRFPTPIPSADRSGESVSVREKKDFGEKGRNCGYRPKQRADNWVSWQMVTGIVQPCEAAQVTLWGTYTCTECLFCLP